MDKKDTIWMEKFIKILKEEKNQEVKAAEVRKFLQPTMRFKPRTDLERIYDTINSVYYGSVKKDGVNKQLKNLQLNEPEDQEISFEEEMPDYNLAYIKQAKKMEEEEKSNIYNIKSLNEDVKRRSVYNNSETATVDSRSKPKKEVKKPKRKFVDNSEARALRKELYNKTHFKATTDFSIFKSN